MTTTSRQKRKTPPSPYWESLKKKIRANSGVSVRWGESACPGTHTVEIYHQDMPMPLCIVWFGFFGLEGIQIMNSFTFEYVRRAGLRTMVHNELLRAYPGRYILSGAGTESGQAWMKATGYKQVKAGWEFRPKVKKEKKR